MAPIQLLASLKYFTCLFLVNCRSTTAQSYCCKITRVLLHRF